MENSQKPQKEVVSPRHQGYRSEGRSRGSSSGCFPEERSFVCKLRRKWIDCGEGGVRMLQQWWGRDLSMCPEECMGQEPGK